MRVFVLSFFLMLFVTGSVFAQEESVTENEKEPPPQITLDNPHIKIMSDKAKALAELLTTEEAKALGHIRENFGILRSIEVARESVQEAVILCSEKNPDLKESITTRHVKWRDDIGAVLDKQEVSLGGSINKTHFQDPEQVQDYLDTIDEAARYIDTQLEKKIVTTMEACKGLMESMDNTQEVILDLITDMGWPGDKVEEETEETDTEEESGEQTP